MKNLIIFLLLLTLYPAFSQTPDSLNTAVDSLQSTAALDSLMQALMLEETAQDSVTKIDPAQLKKDIYAYIRQDQNDLNNQWFKWWTLSSNKHYATLKNPYINITRNGFSYYAHNIQSIRLLQSSHDLYSLSHNGHALQLQNSHYKLPATLTDSEAGLGDFRHSHGNLAIKKYGIFGSDSTGVNLSVAGLNGYWLGGYDTSANLLMQIFHYLPFGYLEFNYFAVNEEFPQFLTLKNSGDDLTKISSNEELLYFHNPYLDFALRYQTGNYMDFERNQLAALLKKNLSSKYLTGDLSLEFINQSGDADSAWFNLNSNLNFNFNPLDFDFNLKLTDQDNHYAEAQLFTDIYKNWGPFAHLYNYSYSDSLLFYDKGSQLRYGAGLAWMNEYSHSYLIYGQADDGNYQDWYLETCLDTQFKVGKLDISLRNWSFLFLNPDLQMQNELELFYNLPYDNGLKLKFTHHYYSDYYTEAEDFVYATNQYDLLIGMRISRNFELRLELVNLTGNYELLNRPLEGFHYLYNMRWYFLN